MISIITPVAYDYRLFLKSMSCYYDMVDEIFIGLDKDRISWNRNKYSFDNDDFFASVKALDKNNKVKIIEENFHIYQKPMENETYEKNRLSTFCTPGNWILQIESDEMVVNPIEFRKWIEENRSLQCSIRAQWVTVFKSFGDSLLIAEDPDGKVQIGTKLRSAYTMARTTNESSVMSPLVLLHYTWGRESKAALLEKFRNWGHAGDFDGDKYANMWDSVTLENYRDFKNIHPLNGPIWPSLKLQNISDYTKRDAE